MLKRYIYIALTNIFIASSVINFLTLIASLYSLQVLDRVISSSSISTLFWLTLLTISIHIVINILSYFRSKILTYVYFKTDLKLAESLYMLRIFNNKREVSKLEDLKLKLRNILLNQGTGFIASCDIAWSALFLLAIFAVHWVNGLLCVAWLGIIFLVSKIHKLISKGNNISKNPLSHEVFLNSSAIVGSGMLNTIWKRLANSHNIDFSTNITNYANSYQYSNIVTSIKSVANTCLFASSAYLVITNQMTSGGIIATSILFSKIISPFANISEAIDNLKSIPLIINDLSIFSKIKIKKQSQNISLDNASLVVKNLSYVENDQNFKSKNQLLLKNINLEMHSGQILVIAGNSNSGKSTLLKALSGFLTPSSGTITLGNESINMIATSCQNCASLCLENDTIFTASLIDNITCFRNIDSQKVISIAKDLGLHDYAMSMTNEYDTILDSSRLSSNIKRKILLSRAFVANSKLLLFENPFNNLDSQDCQKVTSLLKQAKSNGTIIVIETNNRELINSSDMFVFMQNGTIIESGNTKELNSHDNQN